MPIPDAKLISAEAARALIAPLLARHRKGSDLQIVLDDELMLSASYSGAVLALPDNTVVDGDLQLEWETATYEGKRYRGILALGRLTIKGDIRNDNWDGGPFLVALGPLATRHVLKRGAPLLAFAPLDASGTIYCEYNHGSFRALGGVRAQGVVMDDHDHQLAGPVDAPLAVLGMALPDARDPQATLLPEFFDEEDDYGRIYPIDDLNVLLRARILAGQPVFRADAPRGKP
jgi:hypothetical protein